jgi:membrane associated rhomboid family serine protease
MYSLFHRSLEHLYGNIFGMLPIGIALHYDASIFELFIVHVVSVICGAWAIFIHCRFLNGANCKEGIIAVGSSGCVYGMYGCVIPLLIIRWKDIWIRRRVFYIFTLVSMGIAESISDTLFVDSRISYAGHLGGFIGGIIGGTGWIQRGWVCRGMFLATLAIVGGVGAFYV